MRHCPDCKRPNPDDVDFCLHCQEFIAWGGPGALAEAAVNGDEAVTPVAVVAPPASPRPALMLRLPGDEEAPAGAIELTVEPGGQVTLIATVRNETAIVDEFRVEVRGLGDWWAAEPAVLPLMPASHVRDCERDVLITLRPPRVPEAEARPWPFAVRVVAPRSGFVDEQPGTLTILPFHELTFEAEPRAIRGRHGSTVALVVRNSGNATAYVGATGADNEGRCDLVPPRMNVLVPPRARVPVPIAVVPRESKWFGRPRDHILQLAPQVAGDPRPAPPVVAIYRQKAWIPWWAPIPLVLAAIAVAVVLVLRAGRTEVPDVRNSPSAFAAQKQVEAAGLELAPSVRRVARPKLRPGTVVDQSPPPGDVVRRGEEVAIVVAVRRPRTRVPPLEGMLPAKADETLRQKGLTLGAVLPKLNPKLPVAAQVPAAGARRRRGTSVNVILKGARVKVPSIVGGTPGEAEKKLTRSGLRLVPVPPDTPKTAKVVGQIPAPGVRRRAGSVVSVILAKPKPKPKAKGKQKPKQAGGGDSAGAARSARTRAAGDATAPPIPPGTSGAEALALLRAAETEPHAVLRIAEAPPGTVVATDRAEGGGVQLAVSAGFPLLAYDTGDDVRLVGGALDRPVRDLAGGSSSETAPAWTPDGRLVVFRRAGDLAVAPAAGAAPRRLRLEAAGNDLAHPAVAPARDRTVVAFVSRRADAPDGLCFTTLTAGTASPPSCRPVPGFGLGRPAWAPDGTTLLVAAERIDGERRGLLRFRSAQPFAAEAGAWRGGDAIVTPASGGRGVLAAAFSPDGRQVALAGNVSSDDFRITLAAPGDLDLDDAVELPLHGCDVTWRSDGRELAVVQSDPRCAERAGRIVRVRPQAPRHLATVVLSGRGPALQPLETGPISRERLSGLGRPR